MRTQRHTRFANAQRNGTQRTATEGPAFAQVVQDAIKKASVIKKVKEASFEPTNDTCAICMDPMTTKETSITSCNHRYCTACFASHVVHGLTHSKRSPIACPMCRAAVVAVACQVMEYDPYTKRLIQERDILQHKLTRMEQTHTRCARTLEVGETLRGVWDVPDAIYMARYATIFNLEQVLFQDIPRIKHRLNQVESQLRVAGDAAIIIRTQTTQVIWLDWNTVNERVDIRTRMEELKVVV